jgi:hypothetical protein
LFVEILVPLDFFKFSHKEEAAELIAASLVNFGLAIMAHYLVRDSLKP